MRHPFHVLSLWAQYRGAARARDANYRTQIAAHFS
jgi:hypothetical protein